MAKSWWGHFKESFTFSMQSVQDTTGIPMPVPENVWGTYAQAATTLSALISAMRTYSSSDSAGALTLAQLAARSQASGVTLRELFAAGTQAERITAVAGVAASFYVGCAAGAVLYAAEQTLFGDWNDKVFVKDEAVSNARQLVKRAAKYGARPPQYPNLAFLFAQDNNGDGKKMCSVPRVPVNACTETAIYTPGWPTIPINP